MWPAVKYVTFYDGISILLHGLIPTRPRGAYYISQKIVKLYYSTFSFNVTRHNVPFKNRDLFFKLSRKKCKKDNAPNYFQNVFVKLWVFEPKSRKTMRKCTVVTPALLQKNAKKVQWGISGFSSVFSRIFFENLTKNRKM